MRDKMSEQTFTGERFVPGIDDEQLEMEHYQRYYSALSFVEDKIVLDAACGEGYGTSILAARAAKVSGLDLSAEAIARARETYGGKDNIEFVVGSVAQIPFPDHSLDVVVSFETIEHISEELQYKFLDEIKRVLKQDGILIMSTPNKAIYSDLYNYYNKFHVKEFYKEEFIKFLSKNFKYTRLYNQYFEVCSVIDMAGEQNRTVSYHKSSVYTEDGKYFVVIASNEEIPAIDISHTMMSSSPEYKQRIERILALQSEVEARNEHLHKLDKEIEDYRKCIDELRENTSIIENKSQMLEEQAENLRQDKQAITEENIRLKLQNKEEEIRNAGLMSQIEELKQAVKVLNQNNNEFQRCAVVLRNANEELCCYNQELRRQAEEAIKALNESERHAKDLHHAEEVAESRIVQLEEHINQLKQTVMNKEGHIELLLEAEREYEREKNSKTYRLALKFRRLSLWLLPINSKRRFFARLLGKGLRNPRLMLRMINLRRIKNCFTILRSEGVASAVNHFMLVEEYEKSRTISPSTETIAVVPVTEREKKKEDYAPLSFPKWDNPQVSIVIPVYNQFDYTYHCLESILKNSGDCTYEVIIANDCSTDLTREIEDIIQGITVITNKTNLRFLLNCNNAAKYAKGKYLLFLNNDTQVQENWLEPLVSLMKRDKTVGMVGSKLIYADGYLQEAGGILWKDASAWNYGNRQNPNDSEFNYVHEVDYISGAAIMIHRYLWKKIGGFDTRYAPAYCEDSDLAFEVRKHGYKVMLQPKSVVVHFEGVSNGTDVSSGQKKYQVDNQKKFYEKWKEELEKNHFENGTNVFLARDRGRDRKHVLVIDHYVPQYDKDAGSKTTFMYLKMLVKKGYHITFLGDNFYQHEPYTTELQQMGILVLYGPKYAEHWKEWLLENVEYFDIFYLNRPHIAIKYIDIIKEHARGKIIYYGHDLHFLRAKREYELSGDKKLLEDSQHWLEQETYIMKKADMNYYPSVIESDEIHKMDPQIPVKAITAYVFEEFQKLHYDFKERQGLLFVGGFGHGPNLDAVKWFLDKIFPEVYKRVNAPFYIVGSKAPEEITQIKTPGVIVKGFVSEEELERLYKHCRVAVVPLRYGAGVKGKVVEALYYGLPIVTTSVGAEGIAGIQEAAIVKDSEENLIQAICDLYEDKEKLLNMAHKSQVLIKEHFSTEAVWNVIENDFI
ncbi:MAG: glycosyltransferase [Lachnospiraceae bacterium]|nr:glycosyltransferase [Lachnospiraceae bacterium]